MALQLGVDTLATVERADTYNAAHPWGSSWAPRETPDKEARLRLVSRLATQLIDWRGVAAVLSQPLAFPRQGLLTRQGAVIAGDEYPDELQDAVCEWARIIEEEDTDDNVIEDLQVRSVTGAAFGDVVRKVVPSVVLDILPPGWYRSAKGHREMESVQLRRA